MNNSDTKMLFEAYQTVYQPQIIEEGGAYGHMANVHEDFSLTFADLDAIIRNFLSGRVEGEMKEKTDGQALAVSYKKGKVLFARNKGHYTNWSENALKGSKGVAEAFGGHPNQEISKAFTFAAKDLETAIQSLHEDDKYNFFKDGSRWVNLEIIWPETVNVVPYNHKLLVLHNYREYDQDGNVVGGDFDEYSKRIEEMLKKTNAEVQDKFTITSMPIVKLPRVDDFTDDIPKYVDPITDIKTSYNLSDDDRVGDYWVAYMRRLIDNSGYAVPDNVKAMLAFRWAYKGLTPSKRPANWSTGALQRLPDLKHQVGSAGADFVKWVREFEKNLKNVHDEMVLPLKDVFLQLGVQVLKNMSNFLTLNPDEAVQRMRHQLDEVIATIRAGGDEDAMAKIDHQLALIDRAGGMDQLVPTEGLTFTYTPIGSKEQKIFKFTGIFAPVNQILGQRFGNR